jgi:hypothetical protein
MCSACSGDYYGDFEDHDPLSEYSSVSDMPSDVADPQPTKESLGRGNGRHDDPDLPETCAQPQETPNLDEARSLHKNARNSLDSRSEDDYEVLVSANRIVEFRTITAGRSPLTSLADCPCGGRDRPLQAREQSAFPTVKYYQTPKAVELGSDRGAKGLSILLIFSSLVVVLLTALLGWLALR